jgi:hypothetical protein
MVKRSHDGEAKTSEILGSVVANWKAAHVKKECESEDECECEIEPQQEEKSVHEKCMEQLAKLSPQVMLESSKKEADDFLEYIQLDGGYPPIMLTFGQYSFEWLQVLRLSVFLSLPRYGWIVDFLEEEYSFSDFLSEDETKQLLAACKKSTNTDISNLTIEQITKMFYCSESEE